jgi:hypothetical protein
MFDPDQTSPEPAPFDPSAFPDDTLFHERRAGRERRRTGDRASESAPRPHAERRARKERRRRIDPTTFEKQYTDEELEFMNAMQRFKVQSGKAFPSHGDVLRVAYSLGYRKALPVTAESPGCAESGPNACEAAILGPSSTDPVGLADANPVV